MNDYPILNLDELNHAFGKPACHALFKSSPEDFIVREQLSFNPSGNGTHAYLYLQKQQQNTLWVVDRLAEFAHCKPLNIGYAGLKDRQAITSQWFSINLEGIKEPQWDELNIAGVKLLELSYHNKKLKRGCIEKNQFQICLNDIDQSQLESLDSRLQQIKIQGFPNYFGEQRFGHQENNLQQAKKWFKKSIRTPKRQQKSLYLSAVRSMLFNYLLSKRLQDIGWNQLDSSEIFMLNGNRSFFYCEDINSDIEQRFAKQDIHPSLCLWGKTSHENSFTSFELSSLKACHDWCQQLEKYGLSCQRRAIRCFAHNLSWKFDKQYHHLLLDFSLESGSYATSLLRELVLYQEH